MKRKLFINSKLDNINFNVEELDLSNKKLSVDDFKYLSVKLENNVSIKNLNISNNQGGIYGIHIIGYILPTTNIEIINYRNNSIEPNEYKQNIKFSYGYLINENTKLKELYLNNNDIHVTGFNQLFENLKTYQTLELLDLSGNRNINHNSNINVFYSELKDRKSNKSLHIKFCDCGLDLKNIYTFRRKEINLYEMIEQLRKKNILVWLNYYDQELNNIIQKIEWGKIKINPMDAFRVTNNEILDNYRKTEHQYHHKLKPIEKIIHMWESNSQANYQEYKDEVWEKHQQYLINYFKSNYDIEFLKKNNFPSFRNQLDLIRGSHFRFYLFLLNNYKDIDNIPFFLKENKEKGNTEYDKNEIIGVDKEQKSILLYTIFICIYKNPIFLNKNFTNNFVNMITIKDVNVKKNFKRFQEIQEIGKYIRENIEGIPEPIPPCDISAKRNNSSEFLRRNRDNIDAKIFYILNNFKSSHPYIKESWESVPDWIRINFPGPDSYMKAWKLVYGEEIYKSIEMG